MVWLRRGVGSVVDWVFGVSKCKLWHLEWINNEALLYTHKHTHTYIHIRHTHKHPTVIHIYTLTHTPRSHPTCTWSHTPPTQSQTHTHTLHTHTHHLPRTRYCPQPQGRDGKQRFRRQGQGRHPCPGYKSGQQGALAPRSQKTSPTWELGEINPASLNPASLNRPPLFLGREEAAERLRQASQRVWDSAGPRGPGRTGMETATPDKVTQRKDAASRWRLGRGWLGWDEGAKG